MAQQVQVVVPTTKNNYNFHHDDDNDKCTMFLEASDEKDDGCTDVGCVNAIITPHFVMVVDDDDDDDDDDDESTVRVMKVLEQKQRQQPDETAQCLKRHRRRQPPLSPPLFITSSSSSLSSVSSTDDSVKLERESSSSSSQPQPQPQRQRQRLSKATTFNTGIPTITTTAATILPLLVFLDVFAVALVGPLYTQYMQSATTTTTMTHTNIAQQREWLSSMFSLSQMIGALLLGIAMDAKYLQQRTVLLICFTGSALIHFYWPFYLVMNMWNVWY